MENRFKFRAWDKNEKRMIYDTERDSMNYWDGVTGSSVEIVNSQFRNKFLEWQQYTGLKDKNGKEIYEGDICYKKGYGKKCIIRWNKEWLKYEAFYGLSTNGGDLTIGLGYWKEHLCDLCDKCGNNTEQQEFTESIFGNTLEIIGNIYEDGHLLKK